MEKKRASVLKEMRELLAARRSYFSSLATLSWRERCRLNLHGDAMLPTVLEIDLIVSSIKRGCQKTIRSRAERLCVSTHDAVPAESLALFLEKRIVFDCPLGLPAVRLGRCALVGVRWVRRESQDQRAPFV